MASERPNIPQSEGQLGLEVVDREWRSQSGHAAASGGAKGLVLLETSPHNTIEVSLTPEAKALRRVKRLKRNVYLAGKLHSLPTKGKRPDQPWLITTTYDTRGTLGHGAHNWAPHDLSKATDRYRRWCLGHGYTPKYTWVCELQKTGIPHYHMVIWLPQGVNMPRWDRSNGRRAPFWPHGMTNTEKLKTNVGYLMKYLSKMGELHSFPKGLRLNGNGGLDAQARTIRAWHNLPEWTKRTYGVGEAKRAKRGIVDQSTGEILPPAYQVSFSKEMMRITQLRDIPERFHDGAYSTFPRP